MGAGLARRKGPPLTVRFPAPGLYRSYAAMGATMLDSTSAGTCPDQAKHTPHPTGYISHAAWAGQMLLTHRPRECPGCGACAIWEPKDPAVLSAPAIAGNHCTRCGRYYPEGASIRTDDQGGWIASCCAVVADA